MKLKHTWILLCLLASMLADSSWAVEVLTYDAQGNQLPLRASASGKVLNLRDDVKKGGIPLVSVPPMAGNSSKALTNNGTLPNWTDTLTSINMDCRFNNVNHIQPSQIDSATQITLPDPNANRLLIWDDTTNLFQWLIIGSGLSLTGSSPNYTLTATGGGGGTPGGSDTQVQYNNAGSFGGIANATTNGTTLTIKTGVVTQAANGDTALKIKRNTDFSHYYAYLRSSN